MPYQVAPISRPASFGGLGALIGAFPRTFPSSILLSTPRYNEMYCQAGGSNMNGGGDTNNTAKYTSTNGNWSTTTLQFIPSDGSNPVAAGVQVGDKCHIYIDGSTTPVCMLTVSAAVNAPNGPITVFASQLLGTSPTTSATARTIKVGGAWKGPGSTTNWPFSVGFTNATNINNDTPRVNLKNDQTYGVATANLSISFSSGGSSNLVVQGYSVTPGDGGKATFDGAGLNQSGAGLIQPSGGAAWCIVIDIIGQNVSLADSGNSIFGGNGSSVIMFRCIAHNAANVGFNMSGWFCIECEAYDTGKGGVAAGFMLSSNSMCLNCYSHDNNAKSNLNGFNWLSSAALTQFYGCISESNSGHGFGGVASINNHVQMYFCDAYNNQGDGLRNTNTTQACIWNIWNCNFIRNRGYGINFPAALVPGVGGNRQTGIIANCGFGSGNKANLLGMMNFGSFASNIQIIGTPIIYAPDVTPWNSPDTGDFSIVLSAAISAGRGSYTQTGNSKTGTVSYPDVGAAQALDLQGTGHSATATIAQPYGYVGYYYEAHEIDTGAVTITIDSGALPPGLALVQLGSSEWTIRGTPTTVGVYNYVLKSSTSSGRTGYVSEQITIYADPDQGAGGVGGG